MGGPKVDPDEVQRLFLAGQSSADIAERFGVKYPAVNRVIRNRGLRGLPRGDGKALEFGGQCEVVPPQEMSPDMTLDVAVLRFGATHAGRARVAAWAGLPLRRVEQEWHRQRCGRRA